MNFLVGEEVKTNLLYVRFWTTWVDGSLAEILFEAESGTHRLNLEQARTMLNDYVRDWGHYEQRCFGLPDAPRIGDVDLRLAWDMWFRHWCPYHLHFSVEEIVVDLAEIVLSLA